MFSKSFMIGREFLARDVSVCLLTVGVAWPSVFPLIIAGVCVYVCSSGSIKRAKAFAERRCRLDGVDPISKRGARGSFENSGSTLYPLVPLLSPPRIRVEGKFYSPFENRSTYKPSRKSSTDNPFSVEFPVARDTGPLGSFGRGSPPLLPAG